MTFKLYVFDSGLGIGMVLSLIWIILMRWIASVMVWGSIFFLYGILGVGKLMFEDHFYLQNFALKLSQSVFCVFPKVVLIYSLVLSAYFLRKR